MFQHCQNKQEVEKLYKRLAKRLHPDCGGEHELMILLKESYESALNRIRGHISPSRSAPSSKPNEKVSINDKRLAFIKEIRKVLKRLKVDSPVISVIKSLDENQFLTIEQYEWLKDIWHKATQP